MCTVCVIMRLMVIKLTYSSKQNMTSEQHMSNDNICWYTHDELLECVNAHYLII